MRLVYAQQAVLSTLRVNDRRAGAILRRMGETLEEFRRQLRDWIGDNRPASPPFRLPQSFLEVTSTDQLRYLRDWQRRLYDAGYVGFDVPLDYGGRGVDPLRQAIVAQELASAGAPFLINIIGLQWAGPLILAYGTEAQKRRLLPPLLSGEELWCQGFSEPEAGSDLASLQTRAERRADGYVVTGHKVWTTLAHASSWMLLLARTDASVNKYAGLSYFLFPMKSEGVTIRPLVKMTGEGGFNEVLFAEAPMPLDALLGSEGQGWQLAIATLMFERGAADNASGGRDAQDWQALVRISELAQRAQRDGAAAANDPVLMDELVGCWIELEAIRLGSLRARIPELCEPRRDALPMMRKLVHAELAHRLSRLAVQLLGPEAALGLGDAHAPDGGEWPRGYLGSYGLLLGGGTSEVQRNILAERVMGLPKSK